MRETISHVWFIYCLVLLFIHIGYSDNVGDLAVFFDIEFTNSIGSIYLSQVLNRTQNMSEIAL